MSREAIDRLGAKCIEGGSFYVCDDKPIRFIGCCTVDPCKTATGVCPDDSLRNSTFDEFSYNMFKPQACVSEEPEVRWFTCASIDVPFMGCCASHPCEENGCHSSNMSAARLSDNPEEAAIFLGDEEPENGDDDNSGGGDDGDGGLSTGATVGIAVGAAVAIILIAALAWWFLRRRRQRQQEASRTYEPFATTPGGSQVPNIAMRSPFENNTNHNKAPSVSPYSSTFGPSPSPDPRQQQQHMFGGGGSAHPQQYNQHLHQQEHQNQLSWDGSQGNVPSYHSPPLQSTNFSPSPYTSGNDVAGYAPVLALALNHGQRNNDYGHHQQQQQAALPAQELAGAMHPVSELSTTYDDSEIDPHHGQNMNKK